MVTRKPAPKSPRKPTPKPNRASTTGGPVRTDLKKNVVRVDAPNVGKIVSDLARGAERVAGGIGQTVSELAKYGKAPQIGRAMKNAPAAREALRPALGGKKKK